MRKTVPKLLGNFSEKGRIAVLKLDAHFYNLARIFLAYRKTPVCKFLESGIFCSCSDYLIQIAKFFL